MENNFLNQEAKQKTVLFKKTDSKKFIDSAEEIQEMFERKAYEHHMKGREHGHDWDAWRKADRQVKGRHK
ncbi:hypothetical protein KAR91_04530 [Candidatus Pacearchaeota archaeon]|nr:hypothetical protein [Candidatus Pacearchaeota archaeon]